MTSLKFVMPLMATLALVGCNKTEKATSSTANASATNSVNAATMTPEQHKDARESIMKSWGKANKAMGAMVKDPASFNAANFKAEADKLTSQDPWQHFTADAKGGEAKDAVWTDAVGFQQHIDKYKNAAAALTTAAATATNVDGIKTQYTELSASCKSCHEKFKSD